MISLLIISLFGGVGGLTAIGVWSTIESIREGTRVRFLNWLQPRSLRPLAARSNPTRRRA